MGNQLAALSFINIIGVCVVVFAGIIMIRHSDEYSEKSNQLGIMRDSIGAMQESLFSIREGQLQFFKTLKEEYASDVRQSFERAGTHLSTIDGLEPHAGELYTAILQSYLTRYEAQFEGYLQSARRIYTGPGNVFNGKLKKHADAILDAARRSRSAQLIEKTSDIREVIGISDCRTAVQSAFVFRRFVDEGLGLANRVQLDLMGQVALHGNLNALRGVFGEYILLCQDYERQVEALGSAYHRTMDQVYALSSRFESRIEKTWTEKSAEMLNFVRTTLAVAGVILTALVVFTAVYCRRVWRRVSRLRHAIFEINDGNTGVSVPFTDRRDELGGVARAVEEFRLNKRRLGEALVDAQSASAAKTNFLTIMSHELRTPLNAINGYSQIMADETFGPLPGRYRDYAKLVNDSGELLLGIINQILEMAAHGSNEQTAPHPSNIGVDTMIDASISGLRTKAARKNIAIVHEYNTAIYAFCDPLNFRQIVSNLVENAVKFSQENASIRIWASPVTNNQVRIAIRDSGPGMTAHEVNRALQPFIQLEDPLSRKHEGIGLGLSIVDHLCRSNNGRLVIDSVKNDGTTVYIVLPAAGQAGGLVHEHSSLLTAIGVGK